MSKWTPHIGFHEHLRLRCQTEASLSRTSRRKMSISRPSRRKVPMCRHSSVHVQTFVRSPDFRAFTKFSCVHVQTFVKLPDLRAFMFRLSFVHQTFVRLPKNFAFVCKRLSVPRFSCVHQILVRSCLDFCAFIKLLWDDPFMWTEGMSLEGCLYYNEDVRRICNYENVESVVVKVVVVVFEMLCQWGKFFDALWWLWCFGYVRPGSDFDKWNGHARSESDMKRPCSTQTAHEKTLAGPNHSTWPKYDAQL